MDRYISEGMYEDRCIVDTETGEHLWGAKTEERLNTLTRKLAEVNLELAKLESLYFEQQAQLEKANAKIEKAPHADHCRANMFSNKEVQSGMYSRWPSICDCWKSEN